MCVVAADLIRWDSFYLYIDEVLVKLIGVEPADNIIETGRHAAYLNTGTPGCATMATGYTSTLDLSGQIMETHSISAGLDCPGVSPAGHSWLKDSST